MNLSKLSLLVTGLLLGSVAMAQPTISSISSKSAASGTSFTITGTGFNTTAASNTVYFGAAKATVSSASATSLSVTVPNSATYGSIRVVNTGTNLSVLSKEKFAPTWGGTSTALASSKFSTSSLTISGLAATGSNSSIIRRNMGLGDFNNDGSVDIAVMDYTNKKLLVYTNTSSGTTTISSYTAAYTSSATSKSPYDIDVVDFNNDGLLDIIVATSGNVVCFKNTTSGGSVTFSSTSLTVASSFAYLKCADVNIDGKMDIIGFTRVNFTTGAGSIYIYKNTSSSTTPSINTTATTITGLTNLMDLDLGDVNNDGLFDIVLANKTTTSKILLNTSSAGNVSFQSYTSGISLTTSGNGFAVKIADLNLDGKNDIIIGQMNSTEMIVYQNNYSSGTLSASNFSSVTIKNANPTASTSVTSWVIDVGDFDGDGKPDIANGLYGIMSTTTYGGITLIKNDCAANGTITASNFTPNADILSSSVAKNWANAFICDMNKDGKPDIIATTFNKNLNILTNNITLTPVLSSVTATSATLSSGTTYDIAWESSTSGAITKEFFVKTSDYSSTDKLQVLLSSSSGGSATNWVSSNSVTGGSAVSIGNTSGTATYVTPGSGNKTTTFNITFNGTTAGTYYGTITFRYANSSNTASGTTYTYRCTVTVAAKTYSYTGGSYSNLFSGSNTTPSNATPSKDDKITIDAADTQTVVVSSDNQIKQIKVKEGTELTINCSKSGGSKITIDSTFEIEAGAKVKVRGNDTLKFELSKGAKAIIKGSFETESEDGIKKPKVKFTGEGEVHFEGDVKCGANSRMEFSHTADKHIHFDGREQTIDGDGEIEFDEHCHVHFGDGTAPATVNINKPLKCRGKYKLEDSVEIVSNAPNSSSADDWNAWEPTLQLKNDGTYIGSLDTLGKGSTITGGVKWEMWNSAVRSFRTVSFPFENGINLSQITDDLVISGTISTVNPDSISTSCSYCKPSCYYWDETTSAFVAYSGKDTANKVPLGQGILLFFRGMLDNGYGDPNAKANYGVIDIKGQVHTGNFVKNLAYKGTGVFKGYNLVGNPYPSNIDFTKLYRTNVSNYFQIFDPRTKSYNVWNKTSGTLVRTGSTAFTSGPVAQSSIIEAGASFFAIATANNAKITFFESAKSTLTPNTTAFKEEATKLRCNQLGMSMNIPYDTLPYMDAAVIEWDAAYQNSKLGWDEYEVRKFYGGYVGIGSYSVDNEWLTQENRPYTENKIQSFPLKTKTNLYETHRITFSTCPTASKDTTYKIKLVDKFLKKTIEIKDSTQYEFIFTKGDSLIDFRFDIVIERMGDLAKVDHIEPTENKIQELGLYPNPIDAGVLNIKNALSNGISTVSMFNLQGVQVAKFNVAANNAVQTMQLPKGITPGIYTVKLTGSKEEITEKFFVTEK